jgi:hypothetical protein
MVDWNSDLRTKSGSVGILLPAVPYETRRRVMMCRDGSRPSSDPKEQTRPGKEVTTWLYPEDGVARCDRQASDMDLV